MDDLPQPSQAMTRLDGQDSGNFPLLKRSDHALIFFPVTLDQKASKEFAECAEAWAATISKVCVFDFQEVRKFDPVFFRPVVLFHQALKKNGCALVTINASPAIRQLLVDAGLDSVFAPKADLNEALMSAGVKPARVVIDVGFLNPFIDATTATIQTHARTKLKVGKPFLKNTGLGEDMGIAGVISLSSHAFQGSIALCFPSQVFLLVYSNLLGSPQLLINREAEDAVGELLNIIFGRAKARLNENRSFAVREAVPAVISGHNLSVHHTARKPALVIPFETEAGVFNLEVSADVT